MERPVERSSVGAAWALVGGPLPARSTVAELDRTTVANPPEECMRTTRFITAGLAAAVVSGAMAGPAAAVPALDHATDTGASAAQSASPVSGDLRVIPQPPTWPLHPQPITQKVATMADGRPIPQPPTWPLHP